MLEHLKRIIEHNNIHKLDGHPNVLLFSTLRNGSTWLMELILTHPPVGFTKQKHTYA